MKVFLMHKDKDLDPKPKMPFNSEDLIKDLELNTLFSAMALGNNELHNVANKVVLTSLDDIDTINYRQGILKDCVKNPSVIRTIYDITIQTIEIRRTHYLGGVFSNYPSNILYSAVQLMHLFIDMLKKIRDIADTNEDKFESDGFKIFFKMLKTEFSNEYFSIVRHHLKELTFSNGVLISAELTDGNISDNYMLRKHLDKKGNIVKRVFSKRFPSYTFFIDPRDESGSTAISDISNRGINLAANALAQSTEHIYSFFTALRLELSFYIGCLNLYEQLKEIDEPISFPEPLDSNIKKFSFKGLYDICLALTVKKNIVGNDVEADGKNLVIITGANQGGKSTFLRSIGLAQLMMQCGMFVPAEYFSSSIFKALFTHYKRKEDVTMKSGKLDEELSRMSDILDNITPNSIILFNESFAATNEREGSEIAKQIVSALLKKNIKVFFVTHMFELAGGFYKKKLKNAIFLRAERYSGGKRTFKLIEGKPLQTSFGKDLYNEIFVKSGKV